MKVKLEEIIEAMEFADMETEYYYDTKNEKHIWEDMLERTIPRR